MLDARAYFSSFGPGVDVFAPGQDIISANAFDSNNNGVFDDQTTVSGTSFSAPAVARVAARFLQVNPNASPAAVQGAIVNTATPNAISDPGAGSRNLLLFGDLRHAFLGRQVVPFISEATFGVDSELMLVQASGLL